MRLSIDITPDQHKRLKATAAMQGKSLKDYVLERSLPDANEDADLRELENFLRPRLEAAKRGEWTDQTVEEIVAETLQQDQS